MGEGEKQEIAMTYFLTFLFLFLVLPLQNSFSDATLSVSTTTEEPIVLLLTSLPDPVSGPYHKPSSLPLELEKQFRKRFHNAGFEVVVKHNAEQMDLWYAMRNPRVSGLFWVSHAGASAKLAPGFATSDAVMDMYGHNVAPIFTKVLPNLKFLGIVGCESLPFLRRLRSNGSFSNNPGLNIFGRNRKGDARFSMFLALLQSQWQLKATPIEVSHAPDNSTNTPNVPSIPIRVTREIPEDAAPEALTSLRVEINSKIYAAFPKGGPGQSQTQYIFVPLPKEGEPALKLSDLKLNMNSALNLKPGGKPPVLGSFKIDSTALKGVWKPFAKADGTPIGVTHFLYNYQGDLTVSLAQ
jgi:hypothetical protein